MLDHFFLLGRTYASLVGVTESTVSNRVFNGGNRIRDLRLGTTDIGVNRVKAAIRWFSDNWPDGAPWPADVPRPDALPQAAPTPAGAPSTPEAA